MSTYCHLPAAVSPSSSFADSCFLQASQRPPVPGEEDTRQCADDGMQEKLMSNGVISVPSDKLGYALSRTDRPTTHRCKSIILTKLDHHINAVVDTPFGIESEGSASHSPHYGENLSALSSGSGGGSSYLRWAESLKYLLDDSEGVRLFKQFLDQEQGCSAALDFWFACTGLKMVADDPERVAGLTKMIYKRYIKGNRLQLSADIQRHIADRLRQKQIDATMFDEAQLAVEHMMREDAYPLFLKSDTYLQYVQSGSESPRASVNGSNCAALGTQSPVATGTDSPVVGRPLPTVAEDEELASDDIKCASVLQTPLMLTHSTLLATRRAREAVTPPHYFSKFSNCSSVRLSNPYHISYAPVSAQDSELQSLSSDALTDDTLSITDSSVDGRDRAVYNNKRKQLKAIRRNADANQQTDLNQPLIPRTERVPPDSNLAETDPKKFAQLLHDKLQNVKDEEDRFERITNSLRSIDVDDSVNISDRPYRQNAAVNVSKLSTTSVDSFPFTSMLLRSGLTNCENDDNAQSILEEHVLRWDNSSGPTPGGGFSPGLRTPNQPKSASRAGNAANGNHVSRGPTHGGSSGVKSLVHRIRDEVSSSSHDDKLVSHGGGVSQPASVVRHHGHRHPSNQTVSSSVVARESKDSGASRQLRSHGFVEHEKPRVGSRRSTDAAHVGTTGGANRSAMQEQQAVHAVPEVTNERVMLWMLDNEKYSAVKTRCSTDGSDRGSSHKRSSHKSNASGGKKSTQQQQQTHQSSQQLGVQQSRPNRAESLDRSKLSSSGVSSDVPTNHQRSLTQDSMSSSYTEDAKRSQFVVDSSRTVPFKSSAGAMSRSFVSGPSASFRDTAFGQQPSQSKQIDLASQSSQSAVLATFSSSCEDLTSYNKNDRATTRMLADATGVQTVVGYYFCDEPIPYRTTIPCKNVTLGQFKQHIAKKGSYRYFFKTVCHEFESGVVNEEVTNDNDILPLYDGKIIGKIERMS